MDCGAIITSTLLGALMNGSLLPDQAICSRERLLNRLVSHLPVFQQIQDGKQSQPTPSSSSTKESFILVAIPSQLLAIIAADCTAVLAGSIPRVYGSSQFHICRQYTRLAVSDIILRYRYYPQVEPQTIVVPQFIISNVRMEASCWLCARACTGYW